MIERSYQRWFAALELPGSEAARGGRRDGPQVAKSLLDEPDFLRLGLTLALQHRPEEPRAGRCFFRSATTLPTLSPTCLTTLPDSPAESCALVTTYAVAGADGLFIAKEMGGDSGGFDAGCSICTRACVSSRRSGCWQPEKRLSAQSSSAGRGRPDAA